VVSVVAAVGVDVDFAVIAATAVVMAMVFVAVEVVEAAADGVAKVARRSSGYR